MSETLTRIPLEHIYESVHNPRKHFDDATLADLAESLRTAGQLTPIIVRRIANPVDFHYEIAAGHRRFRAAKLAGMTDLLAIVREMDDATFLEVLTIENLQREDVHPLEEADAYRTMLERGGLEVAALAAKVGKSVRYVRDRLTLLRLIPPMQTLYLEGRLLLGHALEIAKCPVPAQEAMLAATGQVWEYVRRDESDFGLESEDGDEDFDDEPEDEGEKEREPTVEDRLAKIRASYEIVSVSALREYIRDEVRLDARAPEFPSLFPDVDPRAAASGVELTDQYWSDDAKVLDRNKFRAAEEGSCDHAVLGLHVLGGRRGRAQWVCVTRECEVHWPTAPKASARVSAGDDEEQEREEYPWEKERREREEAKAKLVPLLPFIRAQLYDAIASASTDVGGLLVTMLQGHYLPRADQVPDECPFPLSGPDQSAAQVIRAAAWYHVEREVREENWDLDDAVTEVCEAMGLSRPKVVRAAQAQEKKARLVASAMGGAQ